MSRIVRYYCGMESHEAERPNEGKVPVWIRRSVETYKSAVAGQAYPHELPDGAKLYHLAEIRQTLADVGTVSLNLSYRTRASLVRARVAPAQLQFQYHLHQEDGDDRQIAEMEFSDDNRVLVLGHRFVDPEYRNREIGTKLLRESERWIQQLADSTGTEKTVVMRIAQIGVMRWALQNGYASSAWDEQLVQTILREPEQFAFRGFKDYRGVVREGYIFPKNDKRELSEGTAIRVAFSKVFRPNSRSEE